MLLRVLRPPLHVRADRRRRRVEDVDLVALDDLPPAVLVGEVGRALVHDAGRAVAERAVDDVAVAGDPADVGGAPVHGVGLDVEDVVVRRRDADEVAGGRVRDPLRLRGRAGRVEEVEEILRVHRLARALRTRRSRRSCHQWSRPSCIGTSPPVRRRTTHVLHASATSATASSAVCFSGTVVPRRHASSCVISDLAPHVLQPAGERVGGEAAEDDRVRRADAGAGEHRDRRLRDHAHVDADRRALLHAERLQRVRELRRLALEIGERDRRAGRPRARLPSGRRPCRRCPASTCRSTQLYVDVELAADEPLRVRQLPFADRLRTARTT